MTQSGAGHNVVRSSTSTTDFDKWRDLIAKAVVPMSSELTSPTPFSGAIAALRVGDAAVMRVQSVGQVVGRDAATCRRHPSGLVKVLIQRHGRVATNQGDQRSLSTPCNMTLYDVDTPYTVIESEHFIVDVLLVPRARLGADARILAATQARPISLETGPAAIFASHVDQLLTRIDDCHTDVALRLADIAIDMLDVALGAAVGVGVPGESMRRTAIDWIRAHLSDEDLDPSAVAAATGLSLRHLHRVFGFAGLRVSSVIRQERLRRIRADLRDPLLSNQTIGAIGARWGFTDQAQLSRLFHQEYGLTPRAFRSILADERR
ncbi:helix-turn-helix domain-containing protein [Streptomyces sp. NPDC046805]|uniref:AraC-like ligand-binding domain-containing protein n=1 Tax=Streptomyces sp. NPDC046805 TaxID=3155134 RepID=UPI0033F208FE